MASGGDLVALAKRFVGGKYFLGNPQNPINGFDCSGLVQYCLQQLGISFPRTTEPQFAAVHAFYDSSKLLPGDLVFSSWPGDESLGPPPQHVAIYAGGGMLVEAANPTAGIHVTPLDSGYKSHVIGYGRIPGLTAGATAGGAGTASSSDTTGGGDSSGSGSPSSSVLSQLGTILSDLLDVKTYVSVAYIIGGAWILYVVFKGMLTRRVGSLVTSAAAEEVEDNGA